MMKALRRLQLIRTHFSKCSYSSPALSVDPSTALVDDKVDIIVTGLNPNQTVTLVANAEENKNKFESRCVMKADEHGKIHNHQNPSIEGTFTGIQPMGLFWSLKSNSDDRIIKKDVSTPIPYTISLYNGSQSETGSTCEMPLASTNVFRYFKKPGVRRIPLKGGKVKGTIFVPEGEGPFPALVDMYGGLVSLIETRAALLASHGYATVALTYLYAEGLPQNLLGADADYIHESTKWFCQHDFVDEKRLGAIGLCFGGALSLTLASICPEIRAVVNLNGIPLHFGKLLNSSSIDDGWMDSSRTYRTNEGVVINEVFLSDDPVYAPAWQHGAKVLQISGDDDKQVHPKWHPSYEKHWPEEFKSNFELVTYPGAGHLIEPPYTPFCRVVNPGKQRMSTMDFLPKECHGEPFMTGGYPEEHAHAQEDSWNRILKFFHTNLKQLKV